MLLFSLTLQGPEINLFLIAAQITILPTRLSQIYLMLTKHILSLKIKQSQFAYLKEKYLPLRVLQVFSCRNPSPWIDCCPYAWLTLAWGVSADKCGVYRTFCVRLHIEKRFWPHDVVLLTYGQNKLLGKIKGKKLIVACIYIK